MSAEISNAIKDSKVERNTITLSENGLIKVSTLAEIGRADVPQSLVATQDSLTLKEVNKSEVSSSTAATSVKLSVVSKSSKTAEPLSSAADVPPSPAGSKSSPESVTSPSIRRTEARTVVQNATQISSTEEKSTPSELHLSASYAASTSTVTSVPTVVQDLNENTVSAKVPVSIGTSLTKPDSASKLAASPTSTESSASETLPASTETAATTTDTRSMVARPGVRNTRSRKRVILKDFWYPASARNSR
ncbi:endochitinase A1-like [Schistocerca piceifrons]|uniref:endochitinase A1-like n=1 Tax=Schistocerca piceifrons TaxID=274613 RepID=UPI001F5F945B|nr:endochitinase A1-like [Schistocerca piceifrons]